MNSPREEDNVVVEIVEESVVDVEESSSSDEADVVVEESAAVVEEAASTTEEAKINILDLDISSENVALNVIVTFVNLAQKRGAFDVRESAKIWECIQKFQRKE